MVVKIKGFTVFTIFMGETVGTVAGRSNVVNSNPAQFNTI